VRRQLTVPVRDGDSGVTRAETDRDVSAVHMTRAARCWLLLARSTSERLPRETGRGGHLAEGPLLGAAADGQLVTQEPLKQNIGHPSSRSGHQRTPAPPGTEAIAHVTAWQRNSVITTCVLVVRLGRREQLERVHRGQVADYLRSRAGSGSTRCPRLDGDVGVPGATPSCGVGPATRAGQPQSAPDARAPGGMAIATSGWTSTAAGPAGLDREGGLQLSRVRHQRPQSSRRTRDVTSVDRIWPRSGIGDRSVAEVDPGPQDRSGEGSSPRSCRCADRDLARSAWLPGQGPGRR